MTSLRAAHGGVPAVLRLENDLDRLILDVADADALPAPAAPLSSGPDPGLAGAGAAPDEQYDLSPWGEDMDDEGVGGFHGHRGTT